MGPLIIVAAIAVVGIFAISLYKAHKSDEARREKQNADMLEKQAQREEEFKKRTEKLKEERKKQLIEKNEFFDTIKTKEDVDKAINNIESAFRLAIECDKDIKSFIMSHLPKEQWVSFTQQILKDYNNQQSNSNSKKTPLELLVLQAISSKVYDFDIDKAMKSFFFVFLESQRFAKYKLSEADDFSDIESVIDKVKENAKINELTPKELLAFKGLELLSEKSKLENIKSNNHQDSKVIVEELQKFMSEQLDEHSQSSEDSSIIEASHELVQHNDAIDAVTA